MNETVLNETDIVPRQWYDHEDRNMSDWVMSLWCNFTHYGYDFFIIMNMKQYYPCCLFTLNVKNGFINVRQGIFFLDNIFPHPQLDSHVFSNPTPNITNNITWEIFNDYNLTYLIIDEHAHLWFQYRQNKYGFWKDFIPKYAVQDYCKFCYYLTYWYLETFHF